MLRFIVPFLFVGCASGNVTTAELEEALASFDEVEADGEVYQPRNGTWTYRSVDVLSDTCANAIDLLAVGDGFSTDRDGLVFDMFFSSQEQATCGVESSTFGCTPLVTTSQPDSTVLLEQTSATRGQMLSLDDMDGVHEVTIACEGAGCAVLEAGRQIRFPCRFGIFFTADTRG